MNENSHDQYEVPDANHSSATVYSVQEMGKKLPGVSNKETLKILQADTK